MVCNLPTELVQLVLRSCDTATYLQLAFCCRSLFELATTSRELVLHQLRQTPGSMDGLKALSTNELFQLLMKRSHQELFGAEHFSERKFIDFHGQKLDARASTLEVPVLKNRALLAFKGDESVYLVDIRAGTVWPRRRLESPAKHLGNIEVLHTSFNIHGAYVLHQFRPFPDKELDTTHPFVQQALRSKSHGDVFLAYHEFATGTVLLYSFHDQMEYDPIAFAAHRSEKFAISWQHRHNAQDHQVVLYTLDDHDHNLYEDEEDEDDSQGERSEQNQPQETEISQIICTEHSSWKIASILILPGSTYDPTLLTEMNDTRTSDAALEGKGPTMKLTFNDRGGQLLHHYRGHTLFSSFQRIHSISTVPEPNVRDNTCVAAYTSALMLQFSIGIPFFATHRTGDQSPRMGTCHWQYLAVGIATHRVEHWTVACLLRSESFPQAHRCTHVMNLDRGRRFDDWLVLAQLGGYQESNTSHGSLIAASPLGTRVASASWKTVTVWALEPQVLIDEETGHYPESWINSAELTELRPAVIQLEAVCSQLRFTDKEDELVAITDRGLLFLDIRPSGRGAQTVELRKSWMQG
ncbi:uncharacterized protein N7482_001363 [Penicillium canariense]|uniref:F-box domain-containing protein n=1 Tax=Penicillium canariense TaxID=189055 RepID=A0A9W9IH09_9EURO|nr:uncharacterized protein N7482_001363 [Penicillium canariense]KAJ5175486.1 hypothetical protein N7482_001363 [Penicillium canariense]